MKDLEKLEIIRNNFYLKRQVLDKKEMTFLLNRETLKNKLINILSPSYFKKKQLILEGFIGVVYTYKIISGDILSEKNIPTFTLFAPRSTLMFDKDLFLNVIKKIEDDIVSKKTSKFLNYYKINTARPVYYKLPTKYAGDKLIYLNYVEAVRSHNSNLKLGFNYVLYAPSITKEVMYLPSRYANEKLFLKEENKND